MKNQLVYNFVLLSVGHYIYVSKDMRMSGYFPKPKCVRGQKFWGTRTYYVWFVQTFVVYMVFIVDVMNIL